MENPNNDKKPLPARQLRFSKIMVTLSLFFLVMGGVLIMSPWKFALMTGVVSGAVSLGIFFTAGYYWGCDNESCS